MTEADKAPHMQPLLRETAYVRLREAIVTGTLLPGQMLHEQALADWLGVGRTPVREALLRLRETGLVTSDPGVGTNVAPLDLKVIREAWAVATAMHRLVVREALAQLTPSDLELMREAQDAFTTAVGQENLEAIMAADEAFHAVPVVKAANRATQHVLDQLSPHIQRLQRLQGHASAAPGPQAIRCHQELIDACATGDLEAALDAAFEPWPLT